MNTMNIKQSADYLGRVVKTLQRWERSGVLVPVSRTKTNRRVYTKEQLDEYLGLRREVPRPTRLIAYCRVSSVAQRPDLLNQRKALEDFCVGRGLAGVEFVTETGGGLNLLRPKFLDLMKSVERGEVMTLVIAHKDRLCRFGFDWFARFCEQHGCTLLVLNHETLSPEQEMIQDLLAIVHCFSARLYGLRNYRKALKKALEKDAA
jgi:predicted site-specific integrase-resolvase